MSMQSWSIFILRACALAAQAQATAGAQAANIQEIFQLQLMHQEQYVQSLGASQARLPTQPIHRSILSHRKRTILPEQKASGDNMKDNMNYGSLRVAKEIMTHESEEVSEHESSNRDESSEPQDGQSSSPPEEPTPPLLTSEWWVRIHEEFGQNEFNYVPESRRAASSVVFTYIYDEDRLLIEENAEFDGEGEDLHRPPEAEDLDDVIVEIDARDNSLPKNASDAGSDGEGEDLHRPPEAEKMDEIVEIDARDNSLPKNASDARFDGEGEDVHRPPEAEDFDEIVEIDARDNSLPNNASDNTTEVVDIEGESNKVLEQGVETEVVDGNSLPNSASETTAEKEASGSEHDHTLNPPKQQVNGSTVQLHEEYMIISGGYTDSDWMTFPVYAFPISSSIITQSGQWIDLSPSSLGYTVETQCSEEDGASAREKLYQEAQYLDTNDSNSIGDPWEDAQHCGPSGRMGHQSVVHNGKLYVFGGLIYDEEQASGGYRKKEAFRLEDVPFVYRLDLNEMFEARRVESNGNRSMQKVLTGWQRIIPRVKPFPTPAGMSSTSAAEVLLSSINRGEMQGGLWSSKSTGGNEKFVMYGGLRIAKLEYDGYGHNPSKFVKGESAFEQSSQMHSHKIVELPLGDVWTYDLVLNCWEKITNNYGRPVKDSLEAEDNDDWWYDLDTSLFPRPRTAHAATVVGNELIIHGGMGWNEHTNDWDGSTDWETLDDMWILDLSTREWTRRWLFPLLLRSYHSLVGWSVDDNMIGWGKEFDNYTSWEGPAVAVFGGYTTGIDIFSGEELAYVFDDLLVSYPPAPKTNYDDPPSPWLKASMNSFTDGAELISTRYEHSAILSEEGVLVVWGGSYQDTKNVKGVWMIPLSGSVNFSIAEEDSIYKDYERTVTALHTIVLMLMFMSISLTLLLGLTQRYQELVQQANDDAAVAAGTFATTDFGNDFPIYHRGNGLHPEIIDTIPRKLYSASENNDGSGGTGGGDSECCPICLLEYEEGDELRVLPCEHFMHKSCLDVWLANNPSCPSCRYSLSELVDDRPMMQLRSLRSRLSNNTALARFLGHDSFIVEDGIEMTDGASDGSVIDLRYVSSLALAEEDTAVETREDQHQTSSAQDPATPMTAMEELGSWRSRRRQLQQERRRSGLASFHQNVSRIRGSTRRSRVPMAELDEE